MSLAPYVQILGRGPGRSRSMSLDEARSAMEIMLSGNAQPEAVGAILMLLRMKGEVADEIAGFSRAAQAAVPDLLHADLDWPSYAAGRTRGLPWFLLSARLVAQAGHRVVIHGWQSGGAVRDGLPAAGIAQARSAKQAEAALTASGITYLPLENFHPALFDLLNLRSTLGLRSCVNTVCRMLNPGRARASVQGVFHPSYRLLQADAAQVLGWRALSVIKGGGGEFERHPGKTIVRFGLRDGHHIEDQHPALRAGAFRLSDGVDASDIGMLWSGRIADAFATDIVIGTAALALETLGHSAPNELATQLWADRHTAKKETAA